MAMRSTAPDEVSDQDLTNIVIHAMRNSSFGSIASEKLLPYYLNRPEEQYVRVAWEVLSSYIEQYKSCPPVGVFESELSRLLGTDEYSLDSQDQDWLDGLDDYIDYIFDESLKIPSDKYIKRILTDFLTMRVGETKFAELKNSDLSYDRLEEEMKKVKKATSLPETNTITPFSMPDDEDEAPYGLGTRNLTPYGVRFMDEMFGGFATKECLGLLGLTGNGKTLLLIQIACAAAQTGVPVLYCSYEQGFSGDVAERVYSYVAEFDRTRVRDKTYKEYPQDIKDKIKGLKGTLKDTLVFADMTLGETGINGLIDIKAMIEKHADKGHKPKIVIIDWLVPFLGRSGYVTSAGDGDLRKAWSSKYGNILKDFAIDNDIHVIIAHQLNTVVLNKPVTYKPNLANAYDLGISFGQYMQICLSIGQLSPDRVCWMNPCKARSSAAIAKIVKMNGGFSRFEDLDNYAVRNGKFVADIPVGTLLDLKGIPLRKSSAKKFEGKKEEAEIIVDTEEGLA